LLAMKLYTVDIPLDKETVHQRKQQRKHLVYFYFK